MLNLFDDAPKKSPIRLHEWDFKHSQNEYYFLNTFNVLETDPASTFTK
jgi:hypothetical protein